MKTPAAIISETSPSVLSAGDSVDQGMAAPAPKPSKNDGEPRFSWDIDITDEPFWASLGPFATKVARVFLQCCDQNDLDEIKLKI